MRLRLLVSDLQGCLLTFAVDHQRNLAERIGPSTPAILDTHHEPATRTYFCERWAIGLGSLGRTFDGRNQSD